MAASIQVMKNFRWPNCSLSVNGLGTRLLYTKQWRISSDNNKGNQCDPNDPKYAKWNEKPHPETPFRYSLERLSLEPVKGKIFEKLPLRLLLEKGKTYNFCTCGYSKTQPFCDNSHKSPHFMSTKAHHVKYRPIQFQVDETKEYWACMCKQSNNRPFCDGSHKNENVQSAVR